jgi:hypothetical protein
MWKLAHLSRSGLLLVAGLVVGALTLGTTYAVSTGPSAGPVEARKTGYVAVSPTAFTPQTGSAAAEGYRFFWDPISLVPDAEQCFNAGLTVPGGAKLGRVAMWFEGPGASADPTYTGVVFRSDPATGVSQRIGTVVKPAGRGITRVVAQIADGKRIVKNDTWQYSLGFCAEDAMSFRGARVIYTR